MNPIKIAIDARFITEKTVGISRYVINLLKGLCNLNPHYDIVSIVNNEHYKNIFSDDVIKSVTFVKIRSTPLSLTEHFEFPFVLKKYHISLFHATSYITPIWVPCKFVYSILDTYHLLFPEGFSKYSKAYFNIVVKNASRKAQHILTISESSKRDIVKYIIATKPISVTYLAAEKVTSYEQCNQRISEIIKAPYMLFLGNHRLHKNLGRVIKAYSNLLEKDTTIPNLVVNLYFDEKYISFLKNKEHLKKILFIGFIPEGQLSYLFAHAYCLVTPSLYEGFGLFILEAMNFNVPVITSNVSSMPEVGGDAVRYVDPYSVEQIAEAMRELVSNEEIRIGLIKKGENQRKKFSWQKCAEQTNDIYLKVLNNK